MSFNSRNDWDKKVFPTPFSPHIIIKLNIDELLNISFNLSSNFLLK